MTADSALSLYERAVDAAFGREDEQGLAVCQRAAFRPEPGRRTLWDGSAPYETWRDMRVRQSAAAELCMVCPALAACRAWLADMDERGLLVDGVVAGDARMWRRSY
ncbi:hypothetical protein [Rhodococcus sp. 14-2470-1a]|uniref:hypothetical protein n=1 Tax=Rhodococcus sp. 14-2470-1a TaxID=2023150 RepID=UPI000B9BDD6C|nr:hypothetical protein [Rhodococcus sp. 14-2470-1a]OZF41890.1 hypothetical protein CH292_27165 [Rhodococcus sp. 14-2470-1a]